MINVEEGQTLTVPHTTRQIYTVDNRTSEDTPNEQIYSSNFVKTISFQKRVNSTSQRKRFKHNKALNHMYDSIISNKKSDISVLFDQNSSYQLTNVSS